MLRHKISTNYFIELGTDDFAKFCFEMNLYYDLEKIEGVSDIEYNAHFGPRIYFTVECDNMMEKRLSKIEETIKRYI